MNYEIVKDEKALKNFITEFLPDLLPGETFYACLLAKSKYCKGIIHINSDKRQLKRFTATKENLFNKIKQCECELGSYFQLTTPIPQEALAIYISPNPRDLIKATKNSLKLFVDLITSPYNGYNPQDTAMSEIQKACARKVYLDFDFDGANISHTLPLLESYINMDCVKILMTRGGFHVLIKLDEVEEKYKKSFYTLISHMHYVDKIGDHLIPIAGCTQGSYVPILYPFEKREIVEKNCNNLS